MTAFLDGSSRRSRSRGSGWKPVRIGQSAPSEPTEGSLRCESRVDREAQSLDRTNECHLQIDPDYVAGVTLRSTGRQDATTTEFHDSNLAWRSSKRGIQEARKSTAGISPSGQRTGETNNFHASNMFKGRISLAIRTMKLSKVTSGTSFPGNISGKLASGNFDTRRSRTDQASNGKRNFYIPCARCGRLKSQIKAEGPIEGCRGYCGAKIENHARPT